MKKLICTLFIIILNHFSYSQCTYVFTDSGGTSGNYPANNNMTYTICPLIPYGVVTVTFTEFNTEAEHDGLYVYNGNSVTLSQIASSNGGGFVPGGQPGSFWGDTIPGPFTSTSVDGCLTFVFKSDGINQNSGWLAYADNCDTPSSGFKLSAFLDSNNNGIKDSGENDAPFGDFEYQINGNNLNYWVSSNYGNNSVQEYNPANIYSFTYVIDDDYSSMYTVTNPTISNVSIGSSPNLVSLNFPITSVVNYNDLLVNYIPFGFPRAGFDYLNRVNYTNSSNTTLDGSLTFVKDNALSIGSISETVNYTPTGFTFDFTNLLPFETRTIDFLLQVPSIPIVSIGQPLTNSVSITTTATEAILTNNSNSFTTQVSASYDPNDKVEAHGDKIVFSTFTPNDYLTYTIRFENTGTSYAQNVSITDVLDSKIDENSIKMVASSHNYNLVRTENNLTWNFKNIYLPVSIPNTITGKGFVTFKAKLKPGFAIGDIVPNKANIYFDTNPAIETNTFITEFVSSLSNSNFNSNDFTISPNPAKDDININGNLTIKTVELYDYQGRLLVSKIVNNIQTSLEMADYANGIYVLRIVDNENNIAIKKVIKE
jgi:uncharacterized repeat protein (TIGR01451 family)